MNAYVHDMRKSYIGELECIGDVFGGNAVVLDDAWDVQRAEDEVCVEVFFEHRGLWVAYTIELAWGSDLAILVSRRCAILMGVNWL